MQKPPKRTFAPFQTQRLDVRSGKPIETIDVDIAADLRIGHDLQDELRKSMSTYTWYAQLKEHAHAAMKMAKYRQHQASERIYDEVRALNPKMSETQVKNKVHLHTKWLKRTRSYMRWRDRYRMLHELCTALRERNDNLRTLEATERREREGKYE